MEAKTQPRVVAGRYEVGEVLGSGGVATVYRARDLDLGREVALKRLDEGAPEDGRHAERFEREARAAAALNHPNVVQVYDVIDGAPGERWIVMELVDGGSLAGLIAREAPLGPARALELARGTAAGLAAVHTTGLLHRDVKPHNVLLTANGTPKVADFGISRADGDPSVTATGMLVGTPAYLAPEQLAGSTATPATDVHGLGLILHQLLGGAVPATVVPPAPPAVEELLADLLAPDPQARPADGAAALRAIDRAAARLPDAATTVTLAEPGERLLAPTVVTSRPAAARAATRRTPLLPLAIGVLLLAAALALYLATRGDDDAGSRAPASDFGGSTPQEATTTDRAEELEPTAPPMSDDPAVEVPEPDVLDDPTADEPPDEPSDAPADQPVDGKGDKPDKGKGKGQRDKHR